VVATCGAGHLEPTAMEDRPRLVLRLEMEPVAPNGVRGDFRGSCAAVACGGLWPSALSHLWLLRGPSADLPQISRRAGAMTNQTF
jgi:hypothetical protein